MIDARPPEKRENGDEPKGLRCPGCGDRLYVYRVFEDARGKTRIRLCKNGTCEKSKRSEEFVTHERLAFDPGQG